MEDRWGFKRSESLASLISDTKKTRSSLCETMEKDKPRQEQHVAGRLYVRQHPVELMRFPRRSTRISWHASNEPARNNESGAADEAQHSSLAPFSPEKIEYSEFLAIRTGVPLAGCEALLSALGWSGLLIALNRS